MAKPLTAAAVAKLKADSSRRVEVPDGLLPGLYLVVQPSGAKSWCARYRAAGQPRKLTLGTYPALDLGAARDAARDAFRRAQKGEDPAGEKQAAKRGARERGEAERNVFDAVARQFLDRYAKPKNRSWRETARLLGLVHDPAKLDQADKPQSFIANEGGLAERWGKRRLQDIARRDIIEVLDEIVDRGAPIAANRTLAALRKLFAWIVDRGILVASPAAGVKPPSAESSRDRVLSDDELRAIWMAADEMAWPFGRLVQALILTGQRRDEVCKMTDRELSLMNKLWSIARERVKNNQAQDVPLSAASIRLFEGLPNIKGESGYIFTTNGRTPVSGFSKAKDRLHELALKHLRKQAEERGEDQSKVTLPPWRLHDIRRTVASGMARLGINLPIIEKVLNHTSGSFGGIVGVYQRHSFADEKRAALESWGRFVTALVEEDPNDNIVALRIMGR